MESRLRPTLRPPRTVSVNGTDREEFDCPLVTTETIILLSCMGAIILAYTWTVPRKRLWPNCCWRRPGLVIPLDFLSPSETNRPAVLLAYGGTVTRCLSLFLTGISANSLISVGALVSFLLHVLAALFSGLLFYPIFLTLRSRILPGALLGGVYTAIMMADQIIYMVNCSEIGTPFGITVLVFEPDLVCLFGLMVHFSVRSAQAVLAIYKQHSLFPEIDESQSWKSSWEVKYVQELLRQKGKREHESESTHPLLELVRNALRSVYDRHDHFRYSVRLLVPLLVGAIAVYELLLPLCYFATEVNEGLLDEVITLGVDKSGTRYRTVFYFGQALEGSLLTAVLLSSAMSYFHILKIAAEHKRNLKELYRGGNQLSHAVIRKEFANPISQLNHFVRFMGYQAAYILTGFVVMTVVICIACLILSSIIIACVHGVGDALYIISGFLGTLVLAVATYFIQRLLVYCYFLGRNTEDPVVTNRRVFNNFAFFIFFNNMMLGLFSALLRVLTSALFGAFMLDQLHRPLLMAGKTQWDYGHQTYLGFLALEERLTHPCLVTFVRLLTRPGSERQDHRPNGKNLPALKGFRSPVQKNGFTYTSLPCEQRLYSTFDDSPEKPRYSSQALNRWFLAITLINNKELTRHRKHFFTSQQSVNEGSARSPVEGLTLAGTLSAIVARL